HKAPAQGLTPKQLRLVTGYMQERLDRNISLEELAGLVGLSRFYFCTAFRLATGKRPHEWLTMERMEHARMLLKNPSLRIIDVGIAVGYQTPSAFAAALRRMVGDTPSNYRRQSCRSDRTFFVSAILRQKRNLTTSFLSPRAYSCHLDQ